MFHVEQYKGNKVEDYRLVTKQLDALLEGEHDQTANLANASALLNQFLDNINWVGFYVKKENELILVPFQGLPASVRIHMGREVSGNAYIKTQIDIGQDDNSSL